MQWDRMSHSSDRSSTHLSAHGHPLLSAGYSVGLWNCILMLSSFFRLAYRTMFCIYLLTEDQKLVWRQFPCLAPLPLQLVGI